MNIERQRDLAPLLLRLFVAFVLVYGTQDNVFDRERMLEFRDFLAGQGFPLPLASAYLSAFAQFFCGILLGLGLFTRFFLSRKQDYEDALSDSVRNIAPLGSLENIRKRCSAGLLALMTRRVERFSSEDFAPRVNAARILAEALGDCVVRPGTGNPIHNYWVFPILADQPEPLMAALRAAGFDAATLRRSQTVPAPEDRPKLDPVTARETLEKLVVLPCYPEMPRAELLRQAEVVRRTVA